MKHSVMLAASAAFLLSACTAGGEYDPEKAERVRLAACATQMAALLVAETEGNEKATTYIKAYLTVRCPDVYSTPVE